MPRTAKEDTAVGIKVRRVGNAGTRERAEAMLARLKSYEDWARIIDPKGTDSDLRTFYDRFRAELVKIARDGQVREISFDRNRALKEIFFER